MRQAVLATGLGRERALVAARRTGRDDLEGPYFSRKRCMVVPMPGWMSGGILPSWGPDPDIYNVKGSFERLDGSLWAAGLSAQEMADFVLSWQPERYLDPQWLRLPRFALTALRGFTGVMKGEAVERLFDERFGGITAGELPIPLATIVYNTDLGLTEYLGTYTTPEVPIARLVRITIALPVFIESVEVRGHLYVDGGLIELLPTQPVIEHGPFDHVFGINFMLPEGLNPDDNTGWHKKPMGIVRASRGLQQAYHVEFARRAAVASAPDRKLLDDKDRRRQGSRQAQASARSRHTARLRACPVCPAAARATSSAHHR
jgi:predicted acylesterase/phospholipase RssA